MRVAAQPPQRAARIDADSPAFVAIGSGTAFAPDRRSSALRNRRRPLVSAGHSGPRLATPRGPPCERRRTIHVPASQRARQFHTRREGNATQDRRMGGDAHMRRRRLRRRAGNDQHDHGPNHRRARAASPGCRRHRHRTAGREIRDHRQSGTLHVSVRHPRDLYGAFGTSGLQDDRAEERHGEPRSDRRRTVQDGGRRRQRNRERHGGTAAHRFDLDDGRRRDFERSARARAGRPPHQRHAVSRARRQQRHRRQATRRCPAARASRTSAIDGVSVTNQGYGALGSCRSSSDRSATRRRSTSSRTSR